jgi:hypothetical protein
MAAVWLEEEICRSMDFKSAEVHVESVRRGTVTTCITLVGVYMDKLERNNGGRLLVA